MEIASDDGAARGRGLGAVLAGGLGRRIGGGKATVELRGRPLVSYPLAAVRAAGLEPLLVAKADTALPPLDCRLLAEPAEPRHPLCGIVAALREARGRALVVVAADMPLLEPRLLTALAALPDPLAIAAPGGEAQPLLGRYDESLLPRLEAALQRREPLRRSVGSLAPRLLGDGWLSRFGEPARLCLNVNDNADLSHAADLLR